ncbi:MAG: type II restriction endonuclease, partial [Ignavibacteriaceae bacterium]|nr:type II restriction endonuclease [Ignavibacteriaceae bacterium]
NFRKSNQHEFQGVQKLRKLLGAPSEKVRFNARFIWLNDDGNAESLPSFVTWSDVRRDNPHRAAEYHLYYAAESEEIVRKASPGDLLVVCKQKGNDLLIIIAPAESTVERQLSWLLDFSLEDLVASPHVQEIARGKDKELGTSVRFILDELGIETDETLASYLDVLLDRFGESFPPTKIFSQFSRETLKGVSVHDDPDDVLLAWIDREELLFRTLEKHIVSVRLKDGFYGKDGADVDGFIRFSLGVQNRRKSRAGLALENHLEYIFEAKKLPFARGAKTEHNSRPDFLFPSLDAYQDISFPSERLSILGVKSSCKDRWRQVLSEGQRVKTKHLFTLEPGISVNQTNEMRGHNLQLVLPESLHDTYTSGQQEWLYNLKDFIGHVMAR